MKEYQAVIHRLSQRTRDDEDALTDLFNERIRGGWEPVMMSQDGERLTIVFCRTPNIETESRARLPSDEGRGVRGE